MNRRGDPVSLGRTATTLTLLLLASIGPGCRGRTPLAYSPAPSVSTEEARAIIRRSFGEQPQGFQVTNLVVTNFKLSFVRRGSFVSGPAKIIFFFETLGRMDITLRPKGYVIRVWDTNRRFRFLVVIPEEGKAKRFMDAMLTLSLAEVAQLGVGAPSLGRVGQVSRYLGLAANTFTCTTHWVCRVSP
jgi:hypothetical protein